MRFLFIVLTLCGFYLQAQQAQQITLENIWKEGTFYPERLRSLKALNHSAEYTILEYNQNNLQEINLYDFASLKKVGRLYAANQEIQRIDDYSFSPDETTMLIATNSEYIYRHSFVADYYLYHLKNKTLQRISNKKIGEPHFSPDGKLLAYARGNNLYYYNIATKEERQITFDGAKNKIINGTADWVYEEEFGVVRLFEWSADGSTLAFVRSDEQQVPEFSMDIYGDGLYPTQDRFKYPKAGEANSVVSLHLYDVASGKTLVSPISAYYIPRLQADKKGNFVVQTLNRHQNDWQLLQVGTTGSTTLLLQEKSKTYVEIEDTPITFLEDGGFIRLSERDGYRHLYHYNSEGKLLTQLTKGSWEVTDFYGYDTTSKELYYQSTENGSINRGVYAVGLNGKGKRALSAAAGTNGATFSSDYKWYIHSFSDAQTPPQYVLRDSKTAQVQHNIIDNKAYAEQLKAYNLPKKEFFELKTSKATLNVYMIKPVDFDANKRYPVLFYQYSGPGSQQVANKWWGNDDFWHSMLTQRGYIVVCVDGRGTGFKGADFKKCTYQQLGKYEVEDQAEAAKIVGGYPYVDASRIGIWGWSFGGFMSSNCLFQHGDIFKAAVAVAPVTNWRFYDTIYTERFMRTPQENAAGYDDNSPITHAAKLEGKYLLIHGSADDNVHVQNAMVLINTLIGEQKTFDWRIYPDKNHGIYDYTGNTRWLLYQQMTRFWEEAMGN